ncbi:hypothetical protein D3C71_1695400 [compost metagenome]
MLLLLATLIARPEFSPPRRMSLVVVLERISVLTWLARPCAFTAAVLAAIALPSTAVMLVWVAYNWLPVTASALVEEITPSAILTIRRLKAPSPSDTVLATEATEPVPSAMALVAPAATVAE